ncbi:hypothetical protein CBER1_09918 [Cercospora berteroae]|uniref:Nucleotide-diphospho-sugar transferase domain-containing protein n=1 Tax=Cercospora berteroae TaxID=357750 RepID=A0A2S6BXL1_9PEZI|nr:hypothetical protein CBER1_09918 [Cercospora berteroae]
MRTAVMTVLSRTRFASGTTGHVAEREMRPHFKTFIIASLGILFFLLLASQSWTAISQYRERQRQDVMLRESLAKQNNQLQASLQQAQDEANSIVKAAAAVTESERSKFAYTFYATTDRYACGVLVNLRRLGELKARYPVHVLISPNITEAYVTALTAAGAVIHVENPPPLPSGDVGYYADCLLKLLAFKLHRISPGLERVLALDSDQLIMQNLDQLFTGLPIGSISAPRAYWIAKDFFASTFMMIDLSDRLWDAVRAAMADAEWNDFDMEIANNLLGSEVTMLSGSYITLNSHWEDWNLPSWYHSDSAQRLNWTIINKVNELSKAVTEEMRRDVPHSIAIPRARRGQTSPVPQPWTETHVPRYPDTTKEDASVSLYVPPKPRFPEHHPLWQELYLLQSAAAVIHFSAVGKPWTVTGEFLRSQRPDAHPLLGEQFLTWRRTAGDVCPGFDRFVVFA